MEIGYVRVSSTAQNTERQLAGIPLEKIYEDKCSGGTINRPQLAACLDFIREGDTLHVHSIDRLARNLEDLLSLIKKITDKKVKLIFHHENMTFSSTEENPMQLLQLAIMGAVAEFERKIIRERQREGIAIARQKGKLKGRSCGKTVEEMRAIAEEARNAKNMSAVARRYRISRPTLYRWMELYLNGEQKG